MRSTIPAWETSSFSAKSPRSKRSQWDQAAGICPAFVACWEGPLAEMKGVARVRLRSGHVHLAELHWYESHGIGRKEIKRKRNLD